MRQGGVPAATEAEAAVKSYERRRLPEKVFGTHRVSNSVVNGEQQQIQVR